MQFVMQYVDDSKIKNLVRFLNWHYAFLSVERHLMSISNQDEAVNSPFHDDPWR